MQIRIGLAGPCCHGSKPCTQYSQERFPNVCLQLNHLKVDETVERAKQEGNLPVYGFHDPESFIRSIHKPRVIIMLVEWRLYNQWW